MKRFSIIVMKYENPISKFIYLASILRESRKVNEIKYQFLFKCRIHKKNIHPLKLLTNKSAVGFDKRFG